MTAKYVNYKTPVGTRARYAGSRFWSDDGTVVFNSGNVTRWLPDHHIGLDKVKWCPRGCTITELDGSGGFSSSGGMLLIIEPIALEGITYYD